MAATFADSYRHNNDVFRLAALVAIKQTNKKKQIIWERTNDKLKKEEKIFFYANPKDVNWIYFT